MWKSCKVYSKQQQYWPVSIQEKEKKSHSGPVKQLLILNASITAREQGPHAIENTFSSFRILCFGEKEAEKQE